MQTNSVRGDVRRREFLAGGLALAGASGLGLAADGFSRIGPHAAVRSSATTVEVIGDGKWIWRKPPGEGKGVFEPRTFEFGTEVRMLGTGDAAQIQNATVVSSPLPEQQIDDFSIDTQGCRAKLRQLTPECSQMIITAPALRKNQVLIARARFRLTLLKQFFRYSEEQFPAHQQYEKRFAQVYLRDTKGISTRSTELRSLAKKLSSGITHPWQKAHAFKKWVCENISSETAMRYTGVVRAIRSGTGDCEERSVVFVALCRHVGIPAPVVWVPNHVWSEFCLHDTSNKLHWIPSHTSGYTWFGLTRAHELVMQKGEGIYVPEQRKKVRFVHDWSKWTGA